MTKKDAYEVALDMYKREHDRWVQNALVLLGVLVSIFALREKSPPPSLFFWLVGIAISATAIVVITSIRLTTDAWRDTLYDIETQREGADCLPFEAFDENLRRYWYGCDLMETLFITKRNVAKRHTQENPESGCSWRCKSFFSVTRAYTRLAIGAFLFFAYEFFAVGFAAPSSVCARVTFPVGNPQPSIAVVRLLPADSSNPAAAFSRDSSA